MKHWLGLTVAGLALMALWGLPPRARSPREASPRTVEEVYMSELASEVRRANEVLKRRRWADSLSQFALGSQMDGVAVGAYDPAVDDRLLELRASLAAERAALEPRDPDMVLGVFWQAGDRGGRPDVSVGMAGGTEFYAGELDGRPYCLVVHVNPRTNVRYLTMDVQGEARNAARSRVCQPFVRHGLPGSRIMSWLEAGGLEFAREAPGRSDDWRSDDWRREMQDMLRRRNTFAGRMSGFAGSLHRHVPTQRCLAGQSDGCLQMVTDPASIRTSPAESEHIRVNSPLTHRSARTSDSALGVLDDYLLSDLEAEFGREAFSRFWTSDEGVPEAFNAAFGVEMGDWVMRWADEVVSLYRPGPRMPWSSVFGGLLTMAFFAALSGLNWRRRTLA